MPLPVSRLNVSRFLRVGTVTGALAGALAACVPSPAPTPAPPATQAPRPAPAPAPAPPPVFQGSWIDAPQTPGDWRWQNAGGASMATFTAPGGQPLLTLRCDRAGRFVELARPGTASTTLDIRTETQDRQVAGGRIASTDTLLDAIAFSRGRFMVGVAGAPPLYVPSYPEITRVVEDCR